MWKIAFLIGGRRSGGFSYVGNDYSYGKDDIGVFRKSHLLRNLAL